MNLGINWIRAYNLLWILLDRSGSPTYHSGPSFLRMVQQINPSSYSYEQLIPLRQSQGLSTSRKSFYWDVIQELQDIRAYTREFRDSKKEFDVGAYLKAFSDSQKQ